MLRDKFSLRYFSTSPADFDFDAGFRPAGRKQHTSCMILMVSRPEVTLAVNGHMEIFLLQRTLSARRKASQALASAFSVEQISTVPTCLLQRLSMGLIMEYCRRVGVLSAIIRD